MASSIFVKSKMVGQCVCTLWKKLWKNFSIFLINLYFSKMIKIIMPEILML